MKLPGCKYDNTLKISLSLSLSLFLRDRIKLLKMRDGRSYPGDAVEKCRSRKDLCTPALLYCCLLYKRNLMDFCVPSLFYCGARVKNVPFLLRQPQLAAARRYYCRFSHNSAAIWVLLNLPSFYPLSPIFLSCTMGAGEPFMSPKGPLIVMEAAGIACRGMFHCIKLNSDSHCEILSE